LGFPTTFLNGKPIQMFIQGEMKDVGAITLEDFISNINKVLNEQ